MVQKSENGLLTASAGHVKGVDGGGDSGRIDAVDGVSTRLFDVGEGNFFAGHRTWIGIVEHIATRPRAQKSLPAQVGGRELNGAVGRRQRCLGGRSSHTCL